MFIESKDKKIILNTDNVNWIDTGYSNQLEFSMTGGYKKTFQFTSIEEKESFIRNMLMPKTLTRMTASIPALMDISHDAPPALEYIPPAKNPFDPVRNPIVSGPAVTTPDPDPTAIVDGLNRADIGEAPELEVRPDGIQLGSKMATNQVEDVAKTSPAINKEAVKQKVRRHRKTQEEMRAMRAKEDK